MKKALLSLIAAVASGAAFAAPAPYPLPINSQAQTAPPVLVYRGSEFDVQARFTDGSTASDVTGCIPFMTWATNALATGVSTSSYVIVSATNGIVNFHFDPIALNFTAGRYMYEIGVRSNAVPRVYRQGIFQIYNSPVGAGVSPVTWSTPVNWSLLDWSNLPTITVNGVTGSIETNLSFTVTSAEADTLATVTARGDFAGTETITPLSVNSKRFGNAAGEDASGTDWTAVGSASGINASGDFWTSVGSSAGKNVIGNAWGSFGFEAGAFASGTSWTAIGNDAGYSANGDVWTAVGYFSGAGAQWWYSSAFGNYAGYHAVGTNQFFADNYLSSPPATAGYATNNMIFGDNGQLNLGRTGALTNALPNQLRGRWQGNGSEFTDMTVSQIAGAYPASNPSNFVTAASVITNINVNGTVGTVADGIASVTVATSANTNKFWTPLTASAGVAIASNVTAGVTVTTLGLPLYMGDRKICIKRASTNLTDTFTVQLTSVGYGRTTITSAVPINASGAIITIPAYVNNGNLFRAETVPGDGPPANNPSVSADIYLVPTAATLSAGAVSVWFLDE